MRVCGGAGRIVVVCAELPRPGYAPLSAQGPDATARDRSPSCSAASRRRGLDCTVSICCRPCSPHRLFQDAGRLIRLLPIQSPAMIRRVIRLQLSRRAQTPCMVAERPVGASHSLRCAFVAQSREVNRLDMPARNKRGLSKVGNRYASKQGRSEQRAASSSSDNANESMDVEIGEPIHSAVPIRPAPARMSDALPSPRRSVEDGGEGAVERG